MKIYPTVENVKNLHQILIDETGGSHGIRDENGLESAIMRPQIGYYNDIFEEATALLESLAMNHPFVDGNKRIAFTTADAFLRMNGYFIECDTEETYTFFIGLFEHSAFNFENLLPWLREHARPQTGE